MPRSEAARPGHRSPATPGPHARRSAASRPRTRRPSPARTNGRARPRAFRRGKKPRGLTVPSLKEPCGRSIGGSPERRCGAWRMLPCRELLCFAVRLGKLTSTSPGGSLNGMAEKSVTRPWSRRLLGCFTRRRALVTVGVVFYCIGLFLVFDFAYSSLTMGAEQSPRVANPVYDHDLAANFDGHDFWGEVRYRLVTNSLGFRDGSVRKVPLKSDSRRILLIGDSFTEGIGMNFEAVSYTHLTLP